MCTEAPADAALTAAALLPAAVCRYNPQDVGRASLLLGSGAILGRRFQPYESHIPFLLQLKVGWLCGIQTHEPASCSSGWPSCPWLGTVTV
jgi:hypothetical protein